MLTVPDSTEPPLAPPTDAQSPPQPVVPEDWRMCPACGEQIRASARKCRYCGEILDLTVLAEHRAALATTTAPRNQPLGATPPSVPKTGLALTSLICALVGLGSFGLTSLPAVVLGHMALGQIKRGVADGAGMATTGVVLGYVMLALVGLIAMISLLP